MADEDDFLDRLYEAAAIPELWPDVLDRLNRLTGLAASVLLGIRGADVRWAGSESFVETGEAYMARGYIGHDERTVRLMQADHAGFLRDLDVFTLAEWEADPIRRDLFVPAGFGWGIATNIAPPTGEILIVHGERRLQDGPPGDEVVRQLDALRPHLARAALLSRRLSFERMSAAAMALEVVGIPAAILDAQGRTLAANGLLEAMAPGMLQFRSARIALASPLADARLEAVLAGLAAGPASAAVQSMPVPAVPGHSAAVMHFYPIRRQARDIFGTASTILLVTPVGPRDVPQAAIIQGLFDLTAAEARVARAIGQGMTAEDVSRANGVSLATVRTQLRAVFDKTGLNRQAELAALLQGLAPNPPLG